MNRLGWMAAAVAAWLPLAALALDDGREGGAPAGERKGDLPRSGEIERFIKRLETENPQEFRRLQELRKNDPEAFRREMRERWQKKPSERGALSAAGEKVCLELAEKYHAAKAPEDAARIGAELQAAVAKAFDEKTADQELRLKKAAAALEKRKASREEICRRRAEELMGARPKEKKHEERREMRRKSGEKPTSERPEKMERKDGAAERQG